MASPPAAPDCQPKHRRAIDGPVRARLVGLGEADAPVSGTGTRGIPSWAGKRRAAGRPPLPIDRRRALRRDGDAVRLHYSRWYRASSPCVEPQFATDDQTC